MKLVRSIPIILAVILALTAFDSTRAAAQTDCTRTPIDMSTMTGSWSSGSDCHSPNRPFDPEGRGDGIYYAVYYDFNVSQISEVTITLESSTDPYLYLVTGAGRNGEELDKNNDIDYEAYNLNSRIIKILEPGDYSIEATTYANEATGEFILTVEGINFAEQRDRAALTAFYHATNGDNWTNNDNWLTDAPLGEWYGVTMNGDGRVTELRLDLNQLTGNIPSEIVNLTRLEHLRLDLNGLKGTIPSTLGSLTNLTSLYLSNNLLTGTIPPELGNLTHLEGLNLERNRLWGKLPRKLTALTHLRWFGLSDNAGLCAPDDAAFQEWMQSIIDEEDISICIPHSTTPNAQDVEALTTLYNATNGDDWDDNTNWFSEQPLQYWKGVTINSDGRVTILDLDINNLSGYLPSELGDLDALEELTLGNQLTGTIPSELGNLTRLELLDLSNNQLSGAIPTELSNLTNLKDIRVYNNHLTGHIPSELGNLSTLDSLRLDGNQLAGTIPSELAKLGNLIRLNLSENELTGSIPPELSNLTALMNLSLDDNQLTGNIPPGLGNLNRLRWLLLDHNQLTGTIPSEIGNLTDLRYVRFAGNQLTGCVPVALRDINANDFDDLNLPFCESPDRAALVALYNSTDGYNWKRQDYWLTDAPLDDWYGVTTNEHGYVVRLDLYDNNLVGTIPYELGNLSETESAARLRLGGNQLTGCIPETLRYVYAGDLARIDLPFCNNPDRDVLVAIYNATDGDNWANNTNWLTDAPLYKWYGVNTDGRWNVHELVLDNNQLTGQLPPEIVEFHAVKAIDFANNQFTGAIPAELSNLNVTALFLAGNQLTGCIPNALRDVRINDFAELGLPFCNESKLAFDECAYEISSIPYQYHGVGVEGMWTRDCESTNRPGSYARFYTLTLYHPFYVTITLNSEQDTYLYLMGGIGANGIVLDENNNHESTNSRLQVPMHPGNYTIEATTHDAGATGSFSLEVEVDVLGPPPPPTAITDRAALTALYHSANGEDWHASDNWLTDAPLSEWHGIETDDGGRVTRLDLEANNLSGELPLEFGNLHQLEWVNISHNRLTGELSRSLTNLTMLEYFYFDNNAGLCAPDYDAFQKWAQTLEDFRGDACAPPPPRTERDALIALYYATRGDNWRNNVGWLTGAPLGEWHGVTTDDDGRVIELNLQDNNLFGHIPPQLGNLTDLTELWLVNNQLSGEIPSELGNLTSLTYLALYGNDLSGEIPAELANLTGLEDLHLGLNRLSGEIPAELGNLTNLESLDLWGNNMSGEIPTEMGGMTNLKHLSLDRNELTGEIPAELGDLINLVELRLNDNQLTGHIPAELGNLTELRTLDLSHNDLTGGMPSELRNLTELRTLDLSHNDLTGGIPTELSNLAELTMLGLHSNPLGGSIPAKLGILPNLERINFTYNGLTGEIPAELGKLPKLRTLGLGGNELTGEIPAELADIETLTQLYLWDNDLTAEEFLPRLGEMTALKSISVGGNRIAGADVLPQAVRLPNLIDLHLRDAQITNEELTPYIDKLANLERLILSENRLTGDELLTQFVQLDNLMLLRLSENRLTGEIPAAFGYNTRLDRLFLNGNQLTGTIPAELGNLSRLTYLYLNDNRLTGPVPAELGNLTGLRFLRLNDNQLTGSLPKTFTRLEYMGEITFDNNAGLCAPSDAAFQEWLQSINNVRGDNCETTPPPPAPSECSEQISDFAAYDRTLTSDCTSENRTAFGNHYARQFTFTLSHPTVVEVLIRSQHIDTHIFVTDDDGETIVDIDDYIGRNAGFRKALRPGDYTRSR